MRSKATSQKKLVTIVWIMKTPIRALCKAKDIYVKGISNFSNTYNRPVMFMEDSNRTTTMQIPRSFSTSMLQSMSTDNSRRDQLPGDLLRVNSTTSMADLERHMIQKKTHQLQPCTSTKGVPRSCSVGMGRIDEDRVSSFRDDCILLKNKVVVRARNSRLSTNQSSASGV